MSKPLCIALLLVTTAGFVSGALAQNPPSRDGQGGPGGGQGGQPPGPPPEAIAACQGKASGASCSFVGRQGETLGGTCFTPPARQAAGNSGTTGTQITPPIACRPDRGGPAGSAPPR